VRPEIKNPIWHMSVRCAPEDRTLSDREWRDAIEEMGQAMGWANHPHVIVRHGADHVHVVVSRVGHDGVVWHGRGDRRAAQQARALVEVRLGLTPAPIRSTPQTKRVADHQVKAGEHRHSQATGTTPGRVELAGRVRAATQAATGLGRAGYEHALRVAGVEFRANTSPTSGRVSGYSFHLPGHVDEAGGPVWWKASALDRDLSWSKTAPLLDEAARQMVGVEVPKGRLETKTRHAARVAAVSEEATSAREGARLVDLPSTINEGQARAAAWWQERQHRARQMAERAAVAMPGQLSAHLRAVLDSIQAAHPRTFSGSPVTPASRPARRGDQGSRIGKGGIER
jgi:hypothetical protein